MNNLVIGLGVLGLYYLSKKGVIGTKDDPKKVPNLPPLDSTGKPIKRETFENFELEACPWFWYTWRRPAIFSEVPISPGSRKRWLDLCDIWLQLREIGELRKSYEKALQIDRYKNNQDFKDGLQLAKNQQAFLFNETKRLAEEQRKYEALYNKVLAQRFTNDEILGFYQIRKDEIINRIFPGQKETVIVPVNEIDVTTPVDVNNNVPGAV